MHQNGLITNYTIIYYCQLGEIFDQENVTVNATTTQYIISGLTPFVGYVVKIAARNANRTGIFFEAAQIFVQDGKYIFMVTCKFTVAVVITYVCFIL